MITITHLNANGEKHFDSGRLNSVYIFAIQRLDHTLECKLPMSGGNHKFTWDFVKTSNGFDITIQDK